MKGGIILTRAWQNRDEDALIYFMDHCTTGRILTDGSLTCVTYLLTFDPANPALSPYRRMRSANLAENVTSILLKIGLRSPTQSKEHVNLDRWDPANAQVDPYDGQIQQNPLRIFNREVETQNRVFRDSFQDRISPCEPICPGIITSSWEPSIRVVNRIRGLLLSGIMVQRVGVSPAKPRDYVITQNLLAIQPGINIIVMEFMEGFRNLESFQGNPRFTNFQIMHFFELLRLRISFNIIHNDPHQENVMIHPDYSYFTNNGAWRGRAIIIDFGEVIPEHLPMTIRDLDTIYTTYENYMYFEPIVRNSLRVTIERLFNQRQAMVATFLAGLNVIPGQLEELNDRVRSHNVIMRLAAPPAAAAAPLVPAPPAAAPPAAPLVPAPLVPAAAPLVPAPLVPAAPPAAPILPAAPPAAAPPAAAPLAAAPPAAPPAAAPPAAAFEECSICLTPFDGINSITQVHITTPCQGSACHFFHTDCYNGIPANQGGVVNCPICRANCNPTRILPDGTQIDGNSNIITPGRFAYIINAGRRFAQLSVIFRFRNRIMNMFGPPAAPAPAAPAPAAPAPLAPRAPAAPAPAAPARAFAPFVPAPFVPAPFVPAALAAARAAPLAPARAIPAGFQFNPAAAAAIRQRVAAEVAADRAAALAPAAPLAPAALAPAAPAPALAPAPAPAPAAPADEPIAMELVEDLDLAPAAAVEDLDVLALEELDAMIVQRISIIYAGQINQIDAFLGEWDANLTALENFYQEMLNHFNTRDLTLFQQLSKWTENRATVQQAETRILETRANISSIVPYIHEFTVMYKGYEVNIPSDDIISRLNNYYNPQLELYDGRITAVTNIKNIMRHNLITYFGASLVGGAILIKRKNDIKKNQTSNNLQLIYDFFGIPFKAYATKLYNTTSLEFLAKIEGSDKFDSLIDTNIPLTEFQYDILNLSTNEFMEKYNINTMKIENNDMDMTEFKKNLNNELNDVSYLSRETKESSGGKKNTTKRLKKHLTKRFTKRLNKRLKKRSTKRLKKRSTKRFTKRSSKHYKKY